LPELEWWDEFFVPQKQVDTDTAPEIKAAKHRFEGELAEIGIFG